MAKQQKISIIIPEYLGDDARQAVAQDVIDQIIKRTQSGKDKVGANFPGYSESYMRSFDFKLAGKGKKPNLTLSGEMLNALTLLESREGEIVIGIPEDDNFNNEKAEGNITGSYGGDPDPRKARDFLGIMPDELNKIVQKYPRGSSADSSEDIFATLLSSAAASGLTETFFEDLDF